MELSARGFAAEALWVPSPSIRLLRLEARSETPAFFPSYIEWISTIGCLRQNRRRPRLCESQGWSNAIVTGVHATALTSPHRVEWRCHSEQTSRHDPPSGG